MVVLDWWGLVTYGGLVFGAGVVVGLALLVWCQSVQAGAAGHAWRRRPVRDWDESRYREGSCVDGHWRGVRWLPGDEDDR